MMMQRLSRESLRIKPPQLPDPQSPIVYDTSKRIKKAFSRNKGTPISEAERRRIDRLRILDERAEKIRQREERKKQNALKRKLKEEKEGPKKIAKLTSSQPELGKFFVSKKEHAVSIKTGFTSDNVSKALGDMGNNDVKDGDPESESESESEEANVESVPVGVKLHIQTNELIMNTFDRPKSPNLKEDSDEPLYEKSIERQKVDEAIEPPRSNDSSPIPENIKTITSQVCCQVENPRQAASNVNDNPGNHSGPAGEPDPKPIRTLHDSVSLNSAQNKEGPRADLIHPSSPPGSQIVAGSGEKPLILLSDWDDTFLTPRTLAELDRIEGKLEAATTKCEEDDRLLETLRNDTDYNTLDDDYDLIDDPRFEYAEGATSPVRQENDLDENEGIRFTSSQAAYAVGLSDPAFDELQENLDSYCGDETTWTTHVQEPEQNLNSSFLCQAFEEDLKELEEGF
ncbi:hypothetical protein TWF694_009473 [Orbilia ellipsospora]|uniref:Uncharacterized protein n=1 Tax=Orbilia ellipsospora TaxID=2528407 RepID=A0AAV9XC45_9PEZI